MVRVSLYVCANHFTSDCCSVSNYWGCPDLIYGIGIRADLGIFPLIGIGNFERGPKPDFYLFIYLFFMNADAHVTLLWQCGNNFRLDLN